MTDRRIATFDLLARLERDGLSAVAQSHGALRAAIVQAEREAAALGDRMETEAFATSAETARYVGAFISAIRAEIAQCETRRKRLQQEADALEDEMRERFRKLKIAEIAAARARLAEQTERKKRDERDRHEAMLMRHARRPAGRR